MSRLELHRRTFLRAGCLGAVGLSLPDLLLAREQGRIVESGGRAKSCIMLFATGGPAQQETFDPKPEADQAVRGEFGAIPTSVPGIHVSELMPRLAKLAHLYCVVRSVYHKGGGLHGAGAHYNLTGQANAPRTGGEPKVSRRDPPCIGGALRQLRGDRNGLPASVHLPTRIGDQNSFQWAGQHAGYLGPKYDPLTLIDEKWNPGTLPAQYVPNKELGPRKLRDRVRLLESLESQGSPPVSETADTYDTTRSRAVQVLESASAWEAFLLDKEKPATLERYGDNRFGRSCLVARRLVEAGVGLVTVPWMHTHSTKNFDTHKKHFDLMKNMLMPVADRAFSALLEDLAERDLLDETLIVWTGEFGRTPKINKDAGRDHWANVYSTVLAGGGIRGGQVYGSSDKAASEPKDNPVSVGRFVATIYHALGYAPGTFVHDTAGRPRPLTDGDPLRALFE